MYRKNQICVCGAEEETEVSATSSITDNIELQTVDVKCRGISSEMAFCSMLGIKKKR